MKEPRLVRLDEHHLHYWNRTQCAGKVGLATQRWRDHYGGDSRCKLSALYRLDGVPLCERHTGTKLIAEMLEAQSR